MRLDYLWAALCILGAVFFVFRANLSGAGDQSYLQGPHCTML